MTSPITQSQSRAPEEQPANESADPERLFHDIDTYPWASDVEFQNGLCAILGAEPAVDPQRREVLTLQARCFYYSRKTNQSISIPAYQEWKAQRTQTQEPTSPPSPSQPLQPVPTAQPQPQPQPQSQPPPTSSSSSPTTQEAPIYPPTFRQIVDLISSGHAIPGIKEVPDTVLLGQASAPTTAKRRKPWEDGEMET